MLAQRGGRRPQVGDQPRVRGVPRPPPGSAAPPRGGSSPGTSSPRGEVGSTMSAPRCLVTRKSLGSSALAAVAPRQTTTSGSHLPSSAASHGRQAVTWPTSGLRGCAACPALLAEAEVLHRVGHVGGRRRRCPPRRRPSAAAARPGRRTGRPRRSSWSPGCSPTSTIRASGGPRRTPPGSPAPTARSRGSRARPAAAPQIRARGRPTAPRRARTASDAGVTAADAVRRWADRSTSRWGGR